MIGALLTALGCVDPDPREVPAAPALWFGGDVHLGATPRGGLDGVVAAVGGAVGVVNLEGPLADGPGGAWIDGATVRLANPAGAPAHLHAAGVRAASVANNHALDDGDAGLVRTIAGLRAADVAPVGGPAGPARLDVDGVPVTLLAYALGDGRGPAASGGPAVPASPVPSTLGADLAAAEGVRVVAFHVDGPPSYLPAPALVAAVEAAVAGGADVVVAHGTHAVGPVERHGDAVVAWGLGNLLFDCACTDEADAVVLRVELSPGRPAEVVPISAGLGGAPASVAADDGVLDLVDALGGTPLARAGGRGRL